MRALTAALAAAAVALLAAAAPAHADPVPPPPYIDHTAWVHWGQLSSLHVYPTPAARVAAGQLGTSEEADEAWTEVLASAPDADTPGMRAQFICHWQFAEFAEPGKVSWNLEPWRPVVDSNDMILSHCNPGGSEEPS
jgi:hypothetical protein